MLGTTNEDLLENDRILIQKINKNPELFLNVSINKFALQANTAISTISKFVRRIGFENYRAFQQYLNKSYYLQNEDNLIKIISLNENDVLALKDCDFFALNETIKKIDFKKLENLVNVIIESQKIWVIGEGNSFLSARDLANSLNTIGLIAFSTNDIFGTIHQLEMLTSQDLLIFVSERFSQREYRELMEKLKKRRVKMGLITAANSFFVPKKIDFVINFFAFPQQTRPEVVGNVKMQQIFINNILINAIIKSKGLTIDWHDVMKW